MPPSELKALYERHNPDGHFFERSNMRFFGDTMKNYGCCDGGEVWVLHRKRPVKHGAQGNAYFCKKTFRLISRMQVEGGDS